MDSGRGGGGYRSSTNQDGIKSINSPPQERRKLEIFIYFNDEEEDNEDNMADKDAAKEDVWRVR